MDMPGESLFKKLPADAVCISYYPLQSEPDPILCPFFKEGVPIRIPADKNLDPIALAEKLTKEVANDAYILIPGSAFDIHGTRHGRGGGWYDRLLSKVPKQWVRVGVLHEKSFFATPLLRNAWDEPVDYLAIQTMGGWSFIETGSRPTDLK